MRLIPLLVCLLAAGAASAETVLRRGNAYEPATLDPFKTTTIYESFIVGDLFEGLTIKGIDATPQPGVAESWELSDDSMSWTFYLRADNQWSDGTPLTSADVVFSFQRLMDPATASQFPTLFYVIKNGRAVNTGELPPEELGVVAVDELTVRIDLDKPAPFLPGLLSNAFATTVPQHAIEKYGDDWVKPGTMISNGAFTLQVWESFDRIEITKNPLFHEAGSVQLDRVIYYPTEDFNSALQRFRSGELDMSYEFPVSRYEWLQENLASETRVSPALNTMYLSVNQTKPPLDDIRVRKALSLAIDRTAITDQVLQSGEIPAYGFVPNGMPGYTTGSLDFRGMPQSERFAEARRLLAEAGYGPQNPLRLNFRLMSQANRMRITAAIAAMWRPLGVIAEINNSEGKVLFADLKSGDFDIGFSGWVADYDDAENFLYILKSDSVNSNYSRYNSPEFDRLMAESYLIKDPAARQAKLAEAEQVMLNDHAVIPVFWDVHRNLIQDYVVGWVPNATDDHLSRYMSLNK